MTFRRGVGGVWCGMRFLWMASILSGVGTLWSAESFTVASYNVENYFLAKFGTRKVKSEASRAKVAEAIAAIRPDVLALQEIGRRRALEELRGRLAAKGLEYNNVAWVVGPDPAIHIAVLSRFPMKVHSHTNVMYLLDRRRFQVSRGFAEARIQVNANYHFTLLVGHLKSKRPVGIADQAEMRLSEARELRKIVEAKLNEYKDENLLVVGDLNDKPNAPPIRTLIGRRAPRLVDLRPAERNGTELLIPGIQKKSGRQITWTYFYHAEDRFSRFDYIMASSGMNRELDPSGTFVYAAKGWGVASDHRPVVARFVAENR